MNRLKFTTINSQPEARPFGMNPAKLLLKRTTPFPVGKRRQNLSEPTLEASCFGGCPLLQQLTERMELGRVFLATFDNKSNRKLL
jgi:hypothetical protein